MIGEYYDLEDRHFSENFKRKYFEKEVYNLMYDWDKIRMSDRAKEAILEIDPKVIYESLIFNDEYRT